MMSFVPRRLFPNYNIPLSNFKGHHQKALTKLGHLAPLIDLILEIRDTRAPISTTNLLFDRVLRSKEKIILYSKKDLSVLRDDVVRQWHHERNEEYLYVDTRSQKDASRILDTLSRRYYKLEPPPPLGLRLLIVGMPNVGKSSLINNLRNVGFRSTSGAGVSTTKRKVAHTGGQPGVTRSTSEIIRLSREPDILAYDTPGVFLPTVKDSETMLALTLAGCVHPSFIDPVIQADYLLYLLNLQEPSGCLYSEYMDHPTNDIGELLFNIARKRNKLKKDNDYDELGMAIHWTNLWRQGKNKMYRGLFDLGVILEHDGDALQDLFKNEKERIKHMNVTNKLVERMGEEENSKKRKRTAKDRESDLKNQLFQLY